MTDNEIVKALNCCGNQMHSCSDRQCKAKTMGNAVELINRQKAEIEILREIISVTGKALKKCSTLAKAEAIKEFAERLKETKFKHGSDYFVYAENIDNLVEEMTEETKHDST